MLSLVRYLEALYRHLFYRDLPPMSHIAKESNVNCENRHQPSQQWRDSSPIVTCRQCHALQCIENIVAHCENQHRRDFAPLVTRRQCDTLWSEWEQCKLWKPTSTILQWRFGETRLLSWPADAWLPLFTSQPQKRRNFTLEESLNNCKSSNLWGSAGQPMIYTEAQSQIVEVDF